MRYIYKNKRSADYGYGVRSRGVGGNDGRRIDCDLYNSYFYYIGLYSLSISHSLGHISPRPILLVPFLARADSTMRVSLKSSRRGKCAMAFYTFNNGNSTKFAALARGMSDYFACSGGPLRASYI